MPIKINGSTSGSTTITAPATGTDETIELSTALAAKANLSGATYTGTHNFTGATVTGISSGLVNVASATYTASSSVSVNNCFTSAYRFYRIVYQATLVGAGNPTGLYLRMRAGGTDSVTGYEMALYQTSNSTSNRVSGFIGLLATTSGGGDITVIGPQIAAPTTATALSQTLAAGVDVYASFGGMVHNVSTSYDGFSLVPQAGGITGSLTVFAYN